VIGDPTRIRQVLLNLVSNAVKFTERGEVVMSVQRTQQPSKGERLVFVVRDTGIGMDAQSIERIFEEFVQADNSTTRRYGGTGLGLAICRRLISLMQGTLTVESQVGQGSTFQFELDLACAPAGYRLPDLDLCRWASGEALRGARILLVDDNLINRKVGMALLRSAGADVDVAEHGLEAIQKVQTEAYHAVLMDIQMPELDGYEATRAIRRFAHLADLPIIAMTAHAMLGIREQCLNAGMNDYVSKPIDPAQMVTVLLRHMDLTTADGWAAEAVAL
jgi:two-component system sensor histidine kinase/response regulator